MNGNICNDNKFTEWQTATYYLRCTAQPIRLKSVNVASAVVLYTVVVIFDEIYHVRHCCWCNFLHQNGRAIVTTLNVRWGLFCGVS